MKMVNIRRYAQETIITDDSLERLIALIVECQEEAGFLSEHLLNFFSVWCMDTCRICESLGDGASDDARLRAGCHASHDQHNQTSGDRQFLSSPWLPVAASPTPSPRRVKADTRAHEKHPP